MSRTGLLGEFVFDQPTLIIVQEKASMSGDDFNVCTQDGQPILNVKGKAVSTRDRKDFYSTSGKMLFSMNEHHMKRPKSWFLADEGDNRICEFEGKMSVGKAKIDAVFKNQLGDGQETRIEIRGDFMDRDAQFMCNGQVVGEMKRDLVNASEVFADKQHYAIEVAPGVDCALMAACCVALDEQQND